ncbi:MAG TPA: PPOX class F420-dependent oxidoreductase [Acidimicrobiales bacterium]
MAHAMDLDEVAAFLDGLPARTGKLASVRADGRPHIAPIWFALDRTTAGPESPVGDLVFNTGVDTVKGRNLTRDPRVALCIDDDTPPFTFVIVEGTATVTEDPDDLVHWATVIGGRYMGADQAEAYGTRNGVPGELVVRLRPSRITAQARLTD